jgi:hypothetical protein
MSDRLLAHLFLRHSAEIPHPIEGGIKTGIGEQLLPRRHELLIGDNSGADRKHDLSFHIDLNQRSHDVTQRAPKRFPGRTLTGSIVIISACIFVDDGNLFAHPTIGPAANDPVIAACGIPPLKAALFFVGLMIAVSAAISGGTRLSRERLGANGVAAPGEFSVSSPTANLVSVH